MGSPSEGILFTYGDKFGIGYQGNQWVFMDLAGGGGALARLGGTIVKGSWEHVTFTYGGFTARGYFKGAPSGFNGVAALGGVGASPIRLGQGPSGQVVAGTTVNTPCDCIMSEFRLWDKELSAAEVAATYNTLNDHVFQCPDDSANLFSAWPMNEGTGTQAGDQSASADQASPHQDLTGSGLTWVLGSPGTPPEEAPPTTLASAMFEELLIVSDGLTASATYAQTENILIGENWLTNPYVDSANSLIGEDMSFTVQLGFEENLVAEDTFSVAAAPPLDGVTPLISEELSQIVTVSFTEYLLASESFDLIDDTQLMDDYYSVNVNIGEVVQGEYTTKNAVQAYKDNFFTTGIPVLQNTLVAVTNATSASNPFAPTLVVNGTTIYAGVGNPAPASVANTSLYFKYLSAGVTGLDLCEIYNFGLNLDYSGGNFQVTSRQPLAGSINNLGEDVTFFGFKGAITESGRIVSSSVKGYKAAGVFGPLLMYKQFGFVAASNLQTRQVTSNQRLTMPHLTDKMTVEGVAKAMLSVVSRQSAEPVTLHWAVQDAPYDNSLAESGMSALEALGQLAARSSGALRWDGNNHYTVAYPDICFGQFTVPDCSLIGVGGLEYTDYVDLGTGLTGAGVVIVPNSAQFDATKNEIAKTPEGQGGAATVNQIVKITKLLTSDDPPLVYDLPQDYDTVHIQILVPATGSTGGTNTLSLNNWVTKRPEEFFTFDVGSGAAGTVGQNTEYIFKTNVGGVMIPQVKVDHRVFPTGNGTVDSGNFVLTLACTRRSLNSAFEQAQKEVEDYQRAIQEWNVQNYKFVKTYSGTIHCLFFGSIPLPGMCASATVGDMTVSGVVESVNFSYPGFLTIQVAKYIRLNMMKPPLRWNTSSRDHRPQGGNASG